VSNIQFSQNLSAAPISCILLPVLSTYIQHSQYPMRLSLGRPQNVKSTHHPKSITEMWVTKT
jgi:hypothetical protein